MLALQSTTLRKASSVLLAMSAWLGAGEVLAQGVQLPPPPPPPLSTERPPSSPPPSNPPPSGGGRTSRPQHSGGGSRRSSPEPATHYAPPPSDGGYEYEGSRTTSIRLNVLPLFSGRLSVDLEFLLAPHHAIVVAPNATFAMGRLDLVNYGFGFTDRFSWGIGTEFGYHYWTGRHLEGLYFGPSGVFGYTGPPAPREGYGYYGLAFDVGWQWVFGHGFTLNVGGGAMLLGAREQRGRFLPRLLAGLGWSF
jgi:hypothetical protein